MVSQLTHSPVEEEDNRVQARRCPRVLEANGEGDPEEQGGQNHARNVGEPLSHEVGEGLQPSRALSKVVNLDI